MDPCPNSTDTPSPAVIAFSAAVILSANVSSSAWNTAAAPAVAQRVVPDRTLQGVVQLLGRHAPPALPDTRATEAARGPPALVT